MHLYNPFFVLETLIELDKSLKYLYFELETRPSSSLIELITRQVSRLIAIVGVMEGQCCESEMMSVLSGAPDSAWVAAPVSTQLLKDLCNHFIKVIMCNSVRGCV